MDRTRFSGDRQVVLDSSMDRSAYGIHGDPRQGKLSGGPGGSVVSESIKRQLAQFGGVENFKRLIGGEERFERLIRTHPDIIPPWELPVPLP